MTDKARVMLTQYNFYPDSDDHSVCAEFSVEHNNGSTSVEQKMTIDGHTRFMHPEYTATIELDDFPTQKTPQAAADKLADWLERLAAAIRIGDFNLPKADVHSFVECGGYQPVASDLDDTNPPGDE